jgi:acyl-CoA synthetase (AMP-forming)/AMP-acid ligase II/acyl carrier protein
MDASEPAAPAWARPRHPPATLSRLLADSIRDHRSAVAIVIPHGSHLTYGDLGRAVDAIAASLAVAGFGRGTRVGIAMPDGPDLAIVMMAVCSAATCAPLNTTLDEEALVRLLVAMRIDALIVPEGPDSTASRAARRAVVTLIVLRGSSCDPAGSLDLVPESPRRSSALEAPLADDIALLMHTSGTTGAPKIVPWQQWRVAETVRNRVELSRIDGSDRCLIAFPLHSSAGIRRALAGLVSGGSIICPGAIAADATIELLESLAPTQYFAPPASHIALLEAFERRTPRPRHGLRTIWGGTTDLPDAVRSRLERAFTVPVIVGYGATESGSIAQTPFPPARAPVGSVGPATNIEIGIADDAGHMLGPDESGEIVVRGPEVFDGYENNDAANRAAFRDGWFRTGDVGRIDRDGFVYVSGRHTEIVNRGGTKIAPSEIEAALVQHPQVIEAAAFAIAHPTLGQDLAAAVVLRDTVSESELRRFLRAGLATFKIPTRIIDVARLPRGSSGKIDRSELAALVARTIQQSEPPIGREETEIARIFADVLKAPAVGRRDNFFDLGGDSLSATHVLAAVDAALGVSVGLEILFDCPTVSEFAAAVARSARVGAAHPASRVLGKIERRR